MTFVLTLLVIAAFAGVYLYWVRPYLKTLPSFANAWVKEATTWASVKAWLDGRKTVLTGVWGTILAMGPDALQIVSGVDLKTAFHMPDDWAIIIGGVAVPMLMLIFRTRPTPPPVA